MEYASPIYSGTAKTHLKEIEQVQHRALKCLRLTDPLKHNLPPLELRYLTASVLLSGSTFYLRPFYLTLLLPQRCRLSTDVTLRAVMTGLCSFHHLAHPTISSRMFQEHRNGGTICLVMSPLI